jgi:hypothetical protein
VAEYCKLLVPLNRKNASNNISSLYRFNDTCLEKASGFKDLYKQNVDNLDVLRESDYTKKIKFMRDKKLLHSDSIITNPETFSGLTLAEIGNGFEMINSMASILEICTRYFEFSFHLEIPHDDYRTEVFIHNHSLINENPLLLFKDVYKRRKYDRLR